MSLYAIGDLHLHYQSVLKATAQIRDRAWKKHEEKLRKNCAKQLTAEDTLVLVGDHSWGRNLAECELDMQYICELPGRKILTRGNHDMFWDAKKTPQLNELYQPRLTFLCALSWGEPVPRQYSGRVSRAGLPAGLRRFPAVEAGEDLGVRQREGDRGRFCVSLLRQFAIFLLNYQNILKKETENRPLSPSGDKNA